MSNQTTRKPRLFAILALLFLSPLFCEAQIIKNGSFESGLAGWTASRGVAAISLPQFPASHGQRAVGIGLQGVAGAGLSQTVAVSPNTDYVLTFDFAAMGSPFHTAVLNVDVIAPGVGALGHTTVARNPPAERNYRQDLLAFRVPANVKAATIAFSDASDDHGVDVDPVIDNVALAVTNLSAGELVVNGGFEAGLSGWKTDRGIYIVSSSVFPAALGKNSVAVGSANVVGSVMSQDILLPAEGEYALQFDFAVMGSRIAALQADVLVNDQVIASTNVSEQGFAAFETVTLPFDVSRKGTKVTLRFSDTSPDDGIAVDPMLDNVRVQKLGTSGPLVFSPLTSTSQKSVSSKSNPQQAVHVFAGGTHSGNGSGTTAGTETESIKQSGQILVYHTVEGLQFVGDNTSGALGNSSYFIIDQGSQEMRAIVYGQSHDSKYYKVLSLPDYHLFTATGGKAQTYTAITKAVTATNDVGQVVSASTYLKGRDVSLETGADGGAVFPELFHGIVRTVAQTDSGPALIEANFVLAYSKQESIASNGKKEHIDDATARIAHALEAQGYSVNASVSDVVLFAW